MPDLISRLFDWLRQSWIWAKFLEPALLLLVVYVTIVSTYWQYLQWRYDGVITLELFRQSHLLLRLTIVFLAVVLVFAVALYGTFQSEEAKADPSLRRRQLAWKAAIAGALLVAIPLATHLLSPRADARPIRVMLTAADEFAPPQEERWHGTGGSGATNVDLRQLGDALVYLLFEINRRQTAWQFELETVRFRRDLVGGQAEESCRGDYQLLCLLESYEEGARRVLITDAPLDAASRARFWLHRGESSVITIWDWRRIEQPIIYEYLAYTLILQALVIHMDASCGETALQAARGEGIVSGNVFENQPQEPGMIAAVLAGHLGPDDQRRLLDCFGPAYLHRAVDLISLDWLRSAPVRDNLDRVYGVSLAEGG